ncbi:dihydrolipoyl dehydrogenase [Halovenus halobia]|uniref:dihydrolipoyl dehydrogenase n=1 Tax=Halovenus halobia TaxID=3396622 RepID=UPI003F54A934
MVVGDVTTGTDVLVIGGGPGGYVAAIRAGQLGRDVTLVEMDSYGGTCLNHGCIPSKAFISATDIAHKAGDAERMGIYADPAVDMQGMVGWKDRLVTRLTKGVESLCEGAGATLIEGRAEFSGENSARIVADGEGQGAESIDFEHAVVATGSRPIQIPGFEFDGEQILSSRDALALESVPEEMVIVGGGYIGIELATVFQKLGCEVTIVEQLDDILPTYGDEVTEVVRERAASLGIDFQFGHAAAGWEETENGLAVHTETNAGEEGRFECEKCLVAVGREPVTDTLNLSAASVETADGRIDTDDRARTNKEHIFAVGDVAGDPMLAHKAFKEGEVAAEVIAGEPSALDYQAIPAAVFTDPEIGSVGMDESAAEQAGFDPIVGKIPLRASGRALTLNEREGFVKVIADSETEFILGARIVGPEASELVAELALAIELGATLEDVAATIHVHPTLSEAVHEAIKGARGQSIHY